MVQAKDVTFTVANGTPKCNNGSCTWTVDGITITGSNVKVSSNNKVYNLQQNTTNKASTFAIASSSSNITKIVVTFTASERTGTATVTEGSSTTASTSYKVSEASGTWTGSAQNKVTFTFSNSGNFRITSFVVTTSDGTTTTTYPAKYSTIDDQTMTVGDADLAIPSFTVTANGKDVTSALTYSYKSDNPAAVTIVDGKLHAVAAGTANITVSNAASGTTEAGSTTFKVTVSDAAQTVTVAAPTIKTTIADADNINSKTSTDATFTVTPGTTAAGYTTKYTTDGSDPKTSASAKTIAAATSENVLKDLKTLNAAGKLVDNTMTVKAVTIHTTTADGKTTTEYSDVATQSFTYVAETPELNPGTQNIAGTSLDVTLTGVTGGTTYYTTNGKEPSTFTETKLPTKDGNTKTFTLTRNTVISAFAIDKNGFRSKMVTGVYTKAAEGETTTDYTLSNGIDAHAHKKNAFHAGVKGIGKNNTNPLVEFYYGDTRTDGWGPTTITENGETKAVTIPKDQCIPTNGNVPEIGGFYEMVPPADGVIAFTGYAPDGKNPHVWIVEKDALNGANPVAAVGLDRNFDRSYSFPGGGTSTF